MFTDENDIFKILLVGKFCYFFIQYFVLFYRVQNIRKDERFFLLLILVNELICND